jgi:hypothetical protein
MTLSYKDLSYSSFLFPFCHSCDTSIYIPDEKKYQICSAFQVLSYGNTLFSSGCISLVLDLTLVSTFICMYVTGLKSKIHIYPHIWTLQFMPILLWLLQACKYIWRLTTKQIYSHCIKYYTGINYSKKEKTATSEMFFIPLFLSFFTCNMTNFIINFGMETMNLVMSTNYLFLIDSDPSKFTWMLIWRMRTYFWF